ncbi:ABC transporter substrate-binding protein [Labedaea rhizosphaerae]|uniref:Carbohydrate ABC transporter substrate-binding protein (CUT1 family) n=1 Tax=Labedaea rhizosphaerae TaxID=598644 RepID=A0A4R6SJ68_LABRH|nr:sugar ABC transporter substrate-binding protein [Labedaea rhizosphaerae]TDQ00969.1 carbohydrate ABC transporter substrate-binding protein (CUT1 family) [Labedaea rhizosphaerae]
MAAQHSRRSFLTLAGMLTAGSALAACGSNTGRGGSGDTTLHQWYHAYGEDGVQAAVKRYAAAYRGGHVEVQWNPGDYDSKILTALQSSAIPDVFEAQVKLDWVRQKQVVPLDDLLGDAKADFVPELLKSQTVDGHLYGIPQAIDTQVLFYRPSLLQAAKITPPTTVDELVEATKALTKDGVKGLFAGNDGGVSVLMGPLLWSAGLDYLNADNTAVGFDDPRAAAAFGKLRDINKSGGLLLGSPTDWSDPGAFTSKRVAMQWTGLWNLPKIQEALGDDIGVLPFPAMDASGKPSVPVGAYSAMVNARSGNVDAAKAFVKWLWVDQVQDQVEFATAFGAHLPARASLSAKAPKLQSGVGAQVVKFVADGGKIASPAWWSARSNTALSDAVARIAREGANPTQETQKALEVAKAELARARG